MQPPSPEDLGFRGDEVSGWTRQLGERQIHFRLLRTLDDLLHAEHLQEEVFQVSERDLIPASELIVVAETGGAVLGAFLDNNPNTAAGVLVGWGGFVGRPRIVSDFLAVRAEARNLGLAAELKRLQAAVALLRGFEEIVWTVDPLRAANARLNFGKLGAVAREYEIDRYGSTFATGLYGGLPSDRIHVTWEIASPRIISRLLGEASRTVTHDAIPDFEPELRCGLALVSIPADIDVLIATIPEAALAWRLRLRDVLTRAFAEGFVIEGFRPAGPSGEPALVLRRERDPRE
jgi:predicted GNAT superfamily acetyltransferase